MKTFDWNETIDCYNNNKNSKSNMQSKQLSNENLHPTTLRLIVKQYFDEYPLHKAYLSNRFSEEQIISTCQEIYCNFLNRQNLMKVNSPIKENKFTAQNNSLKVGVQTKFECISAQNTDMIVKYQVNVLLENFVREHNFGDIIDAMYLSVLSESSATKTHDETARSYRIYSIRKNAWTQTEPTLKDKVDLIGVDRIVQIHPKLKIFAKSYDLEKNNLALVVNNSSYEIINNNSRSKAISPNSLSKPPNLFKSQMQLTPYLTSFQRNFFKVLINRFVKDIATSTSKSFYEIQSNLRNDAFNKMEEKDYALAKKLYAIKKSRNIYDQKERCLSYREETTFPRPAPLAPVESEIDYHYIMYPTKDKFEYNASEKKNNNVDSDESYCDEKNDDDEKESSCKEDESDHSFIVFTLEDESMCDMMEIRKSNICDEENNYEEEKAHESDDSFVFVTEYECQHDTCDKEKCSQADEESDSDDEESDSDDEESDSDEEVSDSDDEENNSNNEESDSDDDEFRGDIRNNSEEENTSDEEDLSDNEDSDDSADSISICLESDDDENFIEFVGEKEFVRNIRKNEESSSDEEDEKTEEHSNETSIDEVDFIKTDRNSNFFSVNNNLNHESTDAPANRTITITCGKKVRFPADKSLCSYHYLIHWSFAHQRARKGLWEQYARDASRFKMRIDRHSLLLNPILDPSHRQKIYEQRFSGAEN